MGRFFLILDFLNIRFLNWFQKIIHLTSGPGADKIISYLNNEIDRQEDTNSYREEEEEE